MALSASLAGDEHDSAQEKLVRRRSYSCLRCEMRIRTLEQSDAMRSLGY